MNIQTTLLPVREHPLGGRVIVTYRIVQRAELCTVVVYVSRDEFHISRNVSTRRAKARKRLVRVWRVACPILFSFEDREFCLSMAFGRVVAIELDR